MQNGNVRIEDAFWNRYRELIRTEMIPYQWKVLSDEIAVNIERERNDSSIPNLKSHAIENFRIAAGLSSGHHYGFVFQDSDVYKWLESVAYSLRITPDAELERLADSVVELIGAAQEEDGYLATYFTIEAPNRKFKRLYESHELYCAGHFFEAAAAYYLTTKKEKALAIACKLADYLDSYFGEGKHFGYDGHEEVEIGLMKLFAVTRNENYRDLAVYFLNVRGTDPDYYARQCREDGEENSFFGGGLMNFGDRYTQNHLPVRQQDTAEGHAVRLVYLCEAMAMAARATNDRELLSSCRKIYENIAGKRLYLTGGIGSTFHGEAFTFDYDLPNDTMYCETCASIGLFYFMHHLCACDPRAEYADLMERALYNTILGGMALDGKHFFYVNPLEVNPEASKRDPGKSHVKPVRPEWLGCACCPPNLARCITSLQDHIYVQTEDALYVNLFLQNRADFDFPQGCVHVEMHTDYPASGKIILRISPSSQEAMPQLAIRIPGWADSYRITANGAAVRGELRDGYFLPDRDFYTEELQLLLPMEPERWYANARVKDDLGRVAIVRGPQVYCLEEADNGEHLDRIFLPKDAELTYRYEEKLLGGVGTVHAQATELHADEDAPLYGKCPPTQFTPKKIRWIPYYAWANRGENRMQVWTREK